MMERRSSALSQAGDGAGDQPESLPLLAVASGAGRSVAGADGLTASGRRLVWGCVVRSLEVGMDQHV